MLLHYYSYPRGLCTKGRLCEGGICKKMKSRGIEGYLVLAGNSSGGELFAAMNREPVRLGLGGFSSRNVSIGYRESKQDDSRKEASVLNETGNIAAVCDGKIYNALELRSELATGHEFKTDSDAEVIVHLYEDYELNCLQKLHGAFAIAIWDSKRERLVLARDRIGIKPLVYSHTDESFIFSSDIKGILASGMVAREIDYEALELYFTFGYIPAPWTIYKHIRKLEPGSYILVTGKGSFKKETYWRIPTDEHLLSFADGKDRLRELMASLVNEELRDNGTVGVFLSGGVDSTIVTGLAARFSEKPIRTFSVGFGNETCDETKFAQVAARFHRTDHSVYNFSPELALDVIADALDSLDEPFADPSLIPTFAIMREARKEVEVVLGGDGADELFGGYNKYLGEYYQRFYLLIPGIIRKVLIEPVLGKLPSSRDTNVLQTIGKAKRFVAGLDQSQAIRHYNWMRLFSENVRSQLLKGGSQTSLGPLLIKQLYDEQRNGFGADWINRMLAVDVMFSLPYAMIPKVEIASTANDLRVRAPFLDHRMVELAFQISGKYKIKGAKRKYILKDSFKELLPPSVQKRGKQGFDMPLSNWFRHEFKDVFAQVVDRKDVEHQGFLDYRIVEELYRRHLAVEEDCSKQLWAVFVFQWWMNRTRLST